MAVSQFLYFACWTLTIVGLVLAARGFIGKQIDLDSYCRRCGYNVSRRDRTRRTNVCSECGADLDEPGAMVLGKRVRKARLIWIGVACIVLAAPLHVAEIAAKLRGVAASSFKPMWLLKLDAASDDPSLQIGAADEIQTRAKNGRINLSELSEFADLAISPDLNRANPFAEKVWAGLLADAIAAGANPQNAWVALIKDRPGGRFIILDPDEPGGPFRFLIPERIVLPGDPEVQWTGAILVINGLATPVTFQGDARYGVSGRLPQDLSSLEFWKQDKNSTAEIAIRILPSKGEPITTTLSCAVVYEPRTVAAKIAQRLLFGKFATSTAAVHELDSFHRPGDVTDINTSPALPRLSMPDEAPQPPEVDFEPIKLPSTRPILPSPAAPRGLYDPLEPASRPG